MALGCLFLMVILFAYCIFKAFKKPVYVLIKNVWGLLFILSAIFTHFDMMGAVAYCVLISFIPIVYAMFKMVFDGNTIDPSNTQKDASSLPYTYTVTKTSSTSF
jgi:hypothetical protein